ncbi:MAG: 3,4-dihydroxy-2-butanone-4-phosphate synthase [Gammaproteobacteria bacterium]|nr:3,4-dihydroxy-2-butanone-4-phosphate synthase [Gammaproteobacteria bacterium]
MPLNSIEEIIEDLRQGMMVIIVDDEQRENEGDLLIAASAVRPEDINFMARHGRGLTCLTLTRERCSLLNLPLMPRYGESKHRTKFTVSIEAAEGVSTGISAADRTTTVRAATKPNAKASDLVQPGHIFPVMAEDGGVLVRAGHTEAGCDLARLAGFEPAAVIVEILNEDGSMARRDDLEKFAQTHNLKIGTIEDLIRYRILHEKTITRFDEVLFHSEFGDFQLIAFQDDIHNVTHVALVKGTISPDKVTRVRVHLENPLQDVFAEKSAHGWPVGDALQRIAEAEQGVFIYLTQPHAGMSLVDRIRAYKNHTIGKAEKETVFKKDSPPDLRTYGVGAQILADLNVGKMEILSAPKVFHGLAAFNLEIVNYI